MNVRKPPYLIEIVSLGRQVKVTALDPQSGLEASVICPASRLLSRAALSALAVRKLEYVMRKKGADSTPRDMPPE